MQKLDIFTIGRLFLDNYDDQIVAKTRVLSLHCAMTFQSATFY